MTMTITYRTGTDQARFPVPVQDIACAVRFASTLAMGARDRCAPFGARWSLGRRTSAAVVALAPALVRGDCPYPAAAPDALIGLAGPYDLAAFGNVACAAARRDGGPRDPDRWEEASALHLRPLQGPSCRSCLRTAMRTRLVPLEISIEFADALEATGHTVRMETLPGADHTDLYHSQIASLMVEVDQLAGFATEHAVTHVANFLDRRSGRQRLHRSRVPGHQARPAH